MVGRYFGKKYIVVNYDFLDYRVNLMHKLPIRDGRG